MPEELRLHLLGGLRISLGQTVVGGFISAKVPALLVYLAVTRRPHFRDALAALLWGDLPDAAARTNLRQVLASLRRTLDPYLEISRDTVGLNPAVPVWTDVEAFESGLREALATALAIFQGEFLAGFFVRDAPDFEDWVAEQRARLHALAVEAPGAACTLYQEQGEVGRATAANARLLALAPWNEEAHRRQMRLLAQAGRWSDALAQLAACRRALRDELGVEPSPETVALADRIRRSASGPRHNLPASPTETTGREEDIAAVCARLATPGCRLLTLLGPGGIGKTRLALEAARRLSGRILDGACWVPIGPAHAPAEVAAMIARALDLPLRGAADPVAQVVEALRPRDSLLALDGFESALEAAGVARARHQPRPPGSVWRARVRGPATVGRGLGIAVCRAGPLGSLRRGPATGQ